MRMKALIGHSGYVGSTLLRQQPYDVLFRSTDVEEARNCAFDRVVVSAAPAMKWVAERDPNADRANIERLADIVTSIKTGDMVLISTVDVYDDSRGKIETDEARPDSVYGRNRLWLEEMVRARFPSALVVRLPGLIGPGLRKNALFDLRNDNNLAAVDARGVFQFYPMVNLSADLAIARAAGLGLVNFAAEPISMREAASGFGIDFANEVAGREPASYDLRTMHAAAFGGSGDYLYDKRASLMAIRAYAQTEPASAPIA